MTTFDAFMEKQDTLYRDSREKYTRARERTRVRNAAPQLLAALEALEHEADGYDYGGLAEELVAALVAARAAIAQAKGE